MKHYLLTWYGITDLRSALGLEATDGPVLSALQTKKYTDVVILAYTNPGKSPHRFADDIRAKWEKWRTSDLETRLRFPRDKSQQFVDAVSNTSTGHSLFIEWLNAKLAANGVSCKIQFIPQELRHLNDAQAIFDAAASAVKLALSDASEKTITTYVSPGTPVMAYTWALIARAHPQHNIAVIASSDPRNPPEIIHLPNELLMALVTGPQAAKPSEYDAIIHLLGRERMPIYFGMLQFKSPFHIFITTPDYQHASNVLSRCLPPTCQSRTVAIQDPFTPNDTRKAIEKQVVKLPLLSKIAVNLTGGTKLMFSGALAACWEHGLEPFYFEIINHNIIYIRDGSIVPFIGIKSVTDIFAVNGFYVVTQGRWEDNPCRASRFDITKYLWTERQTLRQIYRSEGFQNCKAQWGVSRNPSFHWTGKDYDASYDRSRGPSLILNGEEISVPDCNDFGQYLGGGWLEEYVFQYLRILEDDGTICDLRIGLEVDYSGRDHSQNDCPIGEFDCVFTDRKRLWLVECKVGRVKQAHIQKLENNLKTYGGIAARGILVSSLSISPPIARRIQSSTSIHFVHAEELNTEVLERIIAL